MRYKLLLGLTIMASATATTAAQAITSYIGDGNDILMVCTTPQSAIGCVAYLAGVADAMAGGNSVGGRRACISKEVVAGQLVDIAVNYLRSHANGRHVMAVRLIAAAMAETFPCPTHPVHRRQHRKVRIKLR
jgi:hypothetical protein